MKAAKFLFLFSLLAVVSLPACKKSNNNGGPTTTTPPISKLRAKWITDSVNIKVFFSGTQVQEITEVPDPGTYVFFYSETMAETYDGSNRDTTAYVNVNDQQLIMDVLGTGTPDTADILTLTDTELIVRSQGTQKDTSGFEIDYIATLYNHK